MTLNKEEFKALLMLYTAKFAFRKGKRIIRSAPKSGVW